MLDRENYNAEGFCLHKIQYPLAINYNDKDDPTTPQNELIVSVTLRCQNCKGIKLFTKPNATQQDIIKAKQLQEKVGQVVDWVSVEDFFS